MRARVLAVVVMAAISLGMTQAAWAVGGTLTIRFNHDTEVLHGKVESPNMECRIGRAVKLYKVTADGRQLQGKIRTSDSGSWKIELMHAQGNYIAIAPKFEGMHATCDRLVSSTLDVM
ncbi:MAG: hypothetical protein ACXWWX_02890 [Actinomycetota bacterium]